MKTMVVRMKKVQNRKGVYESDSAPKKVDSNRIREIIDRESDQRKRREEPARQAESAIAQTS